VKETRFISKRVNCLYLEANPLRDSEQSTRNITYYQVSLSQDGSGLGASRIQHLTIIAVYFKYEMVRNYK